MHVINLATDFSRFPAGRRSDEGPFSGERFRSELLAPALKFYDAVTVELDGTMGYSSSFLDEAFGGLVLHDGFEASSLKKILTVVSRSDGSLVREVWSYIERPLESHIND